MQITSRFTIAVHVISAISYVDGKKKISSNFLAESVGANPVIIRTILSKLKEAGIVSTSQGVSGAKVIKPLNRITFFDIYKAVDSVGEEGIFHFHENPNPECPIGRTIHTAMDGKLSRIQKQMEEELKSITVAEVERDIRHKLEGEIWLRRD